MTKKHDLMVFCTSAENDCSKYIDRVRHWYAMLAPLHGCADFYCGHDGKLPEFLEDDTMLSNVQFKEFLPKLGRTSTYKFEGWKRSYGWMLRYGIQSGYKTIFHVESDVVIYNWGKVFQYLAEDGLFTSWDTHYNFPEAAFQIHNSKGHKASVHIADRYCSARGITETTLFEDYLKQVPFQFPFKSKRLEGELIPDPGKLYDFTAQSYGR